MTDTKTYVSVKRVELEDLSEGYDKECFAYVRPATFQTRQEVAAIVNDESVKDDKRIELQSNTIKKYFVTGKVNVFDGQKFALADLDLEAALEVPDLNNALFIAIMGWDIDPKGIGQAASESDAPSSDVTAIEKPSSSPEQSQTTSPQS